VRELQRKIRSTEREQERQTNLQWEQEQGLQINLQRVQELELQRRIQ